MNAVQKTDAQLRAELKEIYAKSERGYKDGKWVHGSIIATRQRLCKEAKISPNTMYSFENGNHNLGYELLCRLCDWIDKNKAN